MFTKRIAPAILAAFIAATCIGCVSKQAPAPTPQQYVGTPNNIVKNMAKTVMPPKQLAILKSNAEGIILEAEKPNWTKIKGNLNLIKTNYNEIKPLLATAMVPNSVASNLSIAIGNLEKQIGLKKAYETRLEANKITKYLPDIADMYKLTVPSDIDRLGYFGREIDLNIEKGDWKSAKANYDSAKNMWTILKSRLSTKYKNDAVKFTTELDNLGKAINDKNSGNVKSYAKRMVDVLTVLKTDFGKQTI